MTTYSKEELDRLENTPGVLHILTPDGWWPIGHVTEMSVQSEPNFTEDNVKIRFKGEGKIAWEDILENKKLSILLGDT